MLLREGLPVRLGVRVSSIEVLVIVDAAVHGAGTFDQRRAAGNTTRHDTAQHNQNQVKEETCNVEGGEGSEIVGDAEW